MKIIKSNGTVASVATHHRGDIFHRFSPGKLLIKEKQTKIATTISREISGIRVHTTYYLKSLVVTKKYDTGEKEKQKQNSKV